MKQRKSTISAFAIGLLTLSGAAMLPVGAQAGLFGKMANAVIYPVKKVGTNASVDTHKVILHNSVQPAPESNVTGQKEVVKPDGHKTPVNGQ